MTISNLTIPYPDFVFDQIINPEAFDANNANIKAKMDEIAGVLNGSGYGDYGTSISNTDLNTIYKSGFYKGTNVTNAPTTADTYNFIVTSYDSSNTIQLAFRTNVDMYYIRRKTSGVWSSWDRIATSKSSYVTSSSTITVAPSATQTFVITFPAGFFSATPIVTYSCFAGDINPLYTAVHGITALSATSCTITIINKSASATVNVIFHVRASQIV